jgi:GAF domain-containing protein
MTDGQAPEPSGPRIPGVLLEEATLDFVLDLVVSLAGASLPRVEWASVSLVRADQGGLVTESASSKEIRDLDQVQYVSDRGPCVDAIRTGRPKNSVMAEELDRWPELATEGMCFGVGSVLSLPLTVGDRTTGALNLYSRAPEPFPEDDQHMAATFAQETSVVLANAVAFQAKDMVNAHLQEALASRDLIGQAKGIIMERDRCTADEAFNVLKRISQSRNIKLRDVADRVVFTGEWNES